MIFIPFANFGNQPLVVTIGTEICGPYPFGILKFMFSKKAPKKDEIFTVDLMPCSKRQINGEDFVIFRGLLRKYELYSFYFGRAHFMDHWRFEYMHDQNDRKCWLKYQMGRDRVKHIWQPWFQEYFIVKSFHYKRKWVFRGIQKLVLNFHS